MYRFSTKQNKKVILKVDGRGVTFLYFAANGLADDAFQVDQNWSSIHALVSRLRKKQKYSANDHSFAAWKQGDDGENAICIGNPTKSKLIFVLIT